MVGNGCTDDQFDGDAIVPFIYGMGLISMDMYKVSLVLTELHLEAVMLETGLCS